MLDQKQYKQILNIWAIGRNYAKHADELNNSIPKSEENPIVFLKAGTCVNRESTLKFDTHIFPDLSVIHHEIEIALQFGELTENSQGNGHQLVPVRAYLALDLTNRPVQSYLKEKQWPWTLAKSFKGACPLSNEFYSISDPEDETLKEFENLRITLEINNVRRQIGNTREMIFSLSRLVQFVTANFPVAPGDLLLTGTPSGVGPIQRGDHLQAKLERLSDSGAHENLITTNWQIEKKD